MTNKDDYKNSLNDLHGLIKKWSKEKRDTCECIYAGLHTFISAAFELAPDKKEVLGMLTASFSEAFKRTEDNEIQEITK